MFFSFFSSAPLKTPLIDTGSVVDKDTSVNAKELTAEAKNC